jgi:rubrerythrin
MFEDWSLFFTFEDSYYAWGCETFEPVCPYCGYTFSDFLYTNESEQCPQCEHEFNIKQVYPDTYSTARKGREL